MAVRPSADPSDVQHVRNEVLEDAMANLHAASRRNAHQISALAFSEDTPVTPHKVTRAQWKPGVSANSAASKSPCDGFRRPRCSKITARVICRGCKRARTPCGDRFPCTSEATYTKLSEFTDLASTSRKRLAWRLRGSDECFAIDLKTHLLRDEHLK